MRLVGITALAIFVLDQATKWWILHILSLDTRGVIEVAPPWLTFRMAWNTGINFGLFSGQADLTRWVLIAVAMGIVLFVLVWLRRDPPGVPGLIAGGVLIGGALGNVIDRLVYGAVADFLNMSCCGIDNPYSFNVADIAIFVGAAGLVLFPGDDNSPPARRKKRA
ncbi:Lipoprotein signal peptidase [Roseivivax jejudonensis]|uniref:Lipoprotein signal peptidase n=1 Tax=Roseivivax jejudonensis TaxID=1529041 RepID=A0A1X6ZSS1_9RHOB|nr:signal peptidase II [Roseivivax jejudonensis]SLN60700.1 Lipoprotein signal peptidase [Roseivivax jejudonensis]